MVMQRVRQGKTEARTSGRDWREFGACLTEDPDLFFPITSRGPSARQILAAKAICARCQVRRDCLDYALESQQDEGVWGGTSEDERRHMRRVRARQRQRASQGPGREFTRGPGPDALRPSRRKREGRKAVPAGFP